MFFGGISQQIDAHHIINNFILKGEAYVGTPVELGVSVTVLGSEVPPYVELLQVCGHCTLCGGPMRRQHTQLLV